MSTDTITEARRWERKWKLSVFFLRKSDNVTQKHFQLCRNNDSSPILSTRPENKPRKLSPAWTIKLDWSLVRKQSRPMGLKKSLMIIFKLLIWCLWRKSALFSTWNGLLSNIAINIAIFGSKTTSSWSSENFKPAWHNVLSLAVA